MLLLTFPPKVKTATKLFFLLKKVIVEIYYYAHMPPNYSKILKNDIDFVLQVTFLNKKNILMAVLGEKLRKWYFLVFEIV